MCLSFEYQLKSAKLRRYQLKKCKTTVVTPTPKTHRFYTLSMTIVADQTFVKNSWKEKEVYDALEELFDEIGGRNGS